MTKFLFVTDLDNTLVGDDAAMIELNRILDNHRSQHGTTIVYSTGRSLALYQELASERALIKPDILVLSVGTVIYHQDSEMPDVNWSAKLDQGWDRDQVLTIASHFADLMLQPNSEQTSHKVSYFLSEAVAEAVLPELKTALSDRGLAVQVVYSSGRDLDILPVAGNKGAATNFLQQNLGMLPEQTVVCGDSGNDLALFERVKSRGIIVGNAQPELMDWHLANPSPNRYLAEAHCAGGILEGLQHFGFVD